MDFEFFTDVTELSIGLQAVLAQTKVRYKRLLVKVQERISTGYSALVIDFTTLKFDKVKASTVPKQILLPKNSIIVLDGTLIVHPDDLLEIFSCNYEDENMGIEKTPQ